MPQVPVPVISAEAQSALRAVLGRVPAELELSHLTRRQLDEVLAVLEAEMARLAASSTHNSAARIRALGKLAAAILPYVG
jgi:hypothetical protein